MIDARNVYRKVTRKIYDFSPEQEQNLLAIVWLYRGCAEKFLELVAVYCQRTLMEGEACFSVRDHNGENAGVNVKANVRAKNFSPLPDFIDSLATMRSSVEPFLKTLANEGPHAETLKELADTADAFTSDAEMFQKTLLEQQALWKTRKTTNGELKKAVERLSPLAESSRDLIKQADLVFKLISRLIEICENECSARESDDWPGRDINRGRKAADEARQLAVEQLKQVRYFWKQGRWLTERFPEAKLRDVEGLVKLTDRAEIEANDWSLTPGRYVGVAPEEVDEEFDFEEALRDIHVELEELNAEAVHLAATIKKNFEELGI
jgi:type I restriction enzyme M protein